MKRTITRFLVLTLLSILLCPMQLLAQGNVLFLVGDAGNLNNSDAHIKILMELRGYTVTLQTDDDCDPAVDIVGQDIVLISSTVSSGNVADFSLVDRPLAVWEQADLDDFGMTSSQGNRSPEENIITIDNSHPVAYGLSAGDMLMSESGGLCGGVPYQTAAVIGTLVEEDATTPVWFLYEQGDSLCPAQSAKDYFPADGLAPEMRVCLPFNDPTFNDNTPEATTLLLNTIDYMLDGMVDTTQLVLELVTYDTLDMQPGQKMDLDVEVHPSNAKDGTLLYTSSDEAVAVVSDDGMVTAMASGTVQIQITSQDGGAIKTVDIDVIDDGNASVLFVVGNANMNESDAYIARILETSGYVVNVADDDAAVVEDTLAQDMIIISATVGSGKVVKFGPLDKPIAVWEPFVYDDFAMAHGFGSAAADPVQMLIQDYNHVLTTGMNQDTNIVAVNDQVSRAIVHSTATVIGAKPDEAFWAYWFLYEKGDSLDPAMSEMSGYTADGLALNIRMGMPFLNNSFTPPTPDGVALLLNSADYMADGAINDIRPGVDVMFTEDETVELLHPTTYQVTALAFPYNTTDIIMLESLDEGIATVTQDGLISTVDKGTVNIVAHLNGFTDTLEVFIRNPVFVSGVSLDITEATLEVWDMIQLAAMVDPANADDPSISWSSSDEAVATVDQTGLVEAVSAGSATITVTSTDGGHTATADITVNLQDATLSGLVSNKGTMEPAFSPEVTEYTLTLPVDTKAVFLIAEASREDATVEGDGAFNVASGSATAAIVVTCPAGNTMTYTVNIVVDNTGVNSLAEAGINMYPNPASTSVMLEGIGEGSSVRMINSLGQLVIDQVAAGENMTLDVSGLGQGMYLIQVELDGSKYHTRLIVK